LFWREGQAAKHQVVNPLADFVCKAWAPGAFPLTRFPIEWNHSIEKESLQNQELKHVLGEKLRHLF
jgi:hypothetical protein